MNFLCGWFEFLWKKLGGRKNAAIEGKKASIEKLPNENCKNEEKVEIEIESIVSKEEQSEKKVQCQTMEGKLFEVSSCLLMQSKFFSEMCTNLDLPVGEEIGIKENVEEDENEENEEYSKPSFIFQLPTIKAKCFCQIMDWMRHRRGKPEFELKFGPETGQQIWFTPDEWECQFGFGTGMNLEQLKELYLAANFLNLESLFHYCVQELAFYVIQANNLKMVRQFLCLPDDLSQQENEAIYREFDLHIPNEEISNLEKENKEQISLPPELIYPIFAKLPLSDQRWLLTLNRDAYKYLAGRVRENWPKWKEALNGFVNEEISSAWRHGSSSVSIPLLWQQPQNNNNWEQWHALRFLADNALQKEMQNAINSIEEGERNKNICRKDLQSQLERAIDRLERLLSAEENLQWNLTEIMPRFENKTSTIPFKRGLHHLVEERRQIVEQLKETGLKKLKNKLDDLEDLYWLRRL